MTHRGLALYGGTPVRQHSFPTWPQSTSEIEQAVLEVLASGQWGIGGPRVAQLEEELRSLTGSQSVIAVTNGTHALELALRGLGIGPGDEVLVPSLTFISSASSVEFVGATAIPVDVDPTTCQINSASALASATGSTAAIMPVHLGGHTADMEEVLRVAQRLGIPVVEDAAQAVGAQWKGRTAGTIGTLGTYSFQSAKTLPSGEGGAVLVNDESLVRHIRLLANCGRQMGKSGYDHEVIGSNFRITEFQAAIVLTQLAALKSRREIRETAARLLVQRLRETTLGRVVEPIPECVSAWYMVIVEVGAGVLSTMSARDVATALTAEGIPCSEMYPAFHTTAAFGRRRGLTPVGEELSGRLIWMPHQVLCAGIDGIEDIVDAADKVQRYASHQS